LIYIASGSRAVQTLVGGSIDVAEIGGPAGVDAKLAGADTVYVALPVTRVLVFTVAAPEFNGSRVCGAKYWRHAHRHGDGLSSLYLRQNNLVRTKMS
jgi:hypothetical protein